MSVVRGVAQTVVTTLRAARVATVGGAQASRFVGRNLLRVRERGAGGETGMLRLLDLHAGSCAGDTLVALGLAGTVFFSVPAGQARDRVALYLVVTMLPFALLAPVVGPVLDRFRHGRRYALATTMLGRAFLAFLISEHLTGWALYPAAFGMLVLSRAYGVARSAAVPRVLPPGLGLSEAGARASVFGTLAGALVLPLGLLAAHFGGQWPLRLAIVVFFYGMVTALRLPPRADSDPPEQVPRLLQRPSHRGAKVLSGRLVVAVLTGCATLRALFGFLTLFLVFAIKEGTMPVRLGPWQLSQQVAVVVVAGALGVGSFLATAIGTRLRIHRPTLLQAVGIVLTAFVAVLAAERGSLGAVTLLCLLTAVTSGLAKLAVDSAVQERVEESVRASAFAHSETLLMVAWVLGAGVGLIPFGSGWGLLVAAIFIVAGALKALYSAIVLRKERLRGAPADSSEQPTDPVPSQAAGTAGGGAAASGVAGDATTVPQPSRSGGGPSGTAFAGGSARGPSASPAGAGAGATRRMPMQPTGSRAAGAEARGSDGAAVGKGAAGGRRGLFGWGRRDAGSAGAEGAPGGRAGDGPVPGATRRMPAVEVDETTSLAPPGYTLYRPSGVDATKRLEDDDR